MVFGGHRRLLCRPHPQPGSEQDAAGDQCRRQEDSDAPGHLREATRKAAERATRTFRTRLSTGEKTCRKRMATLAVVHDADPAPRRPHDIIAPPAGRTTRRTPRKGPKARAKWLTAAVQHDADQVIAATFDEAQARDPQHRRCRPRGVSTPPPILTPRHGAGPRPPGSSPATPSAPSQASAHKPTGWACPQTSGPQRTGPATTWRTTPPISTTTRHSRPVERPRSRSRPDPSGPHQQRRLPAVLDLPHPQRARTPLPPLRPAQQRTPGLTDELTPEDPHPSRSGSPSLNRPLPARSTPIVSKVTGNSSGRTPGSECAEQLRCRARGFGHPATSPLRVPPGGTRAA